ncbi:HPr family phosphocarrier protein [Aquabacter spiritensis]|uniref:Phosphocarrier protein n=1 Tax=Aquabacter spiritensis TaxID=933073 RepID=A0A4R3M4N3_9HYPH|nr:HPr family phosphocarrier protein [Aquabacter spiritensis]TCT08294.1 phosphocarrier protein [Aquabacter spiritensis]
MSQVASLPESDAAAAHACGAAPAEGALVRTLPIVNKRGLHARASAKFVQTVERFTAVVTVCRNGEAVNGNSIMGLLMLGAAPGTSVTVTASGSDAAAALEALAALVADRFGEEE